MLLAKLLHPALTSHRINLVDWHDNLHEVGPGQTPLLATVAIRSARAHRRILFNPQLGVGEAFVRGELEILEGDLAELIAALHAELRRRRAPLLLRWRPMLTKLLRQFHQLNSLRRATHHVAHHYDLDYDFFRLWLDKELHYSCAFFNTTDDSLEEAQQEKARRIAAKLNLRPGDRVLDIGCGWGAMALHLIREMDIHVTGISLSKEQLDVARRRAVELGVDDRVAFEFSDYREHTGSYERIVSIGMLEHVGAPQLARYFRVIQSNLTDDGVALVHTIGRIGRPEVTNPWIRKYIFPGGFIPSISEMAHAIEGTGLITADVEVLRLHYAYTLRAWRDRFLAQRTEIEGRYGSEFFRMWEFYLCGSEASFLSGYHVNYQIQLCLQLDALPLTRDHLARR